METHRAVALGFFDGVHIGHGALLQKTRQRADELGIPACAMSFDASPLSIIGGAGAPLGLDHFEVVDGQLNRRSRAGPQDRARDRADDIEGLLVAELPGS